MKGISLRYKLLAALTVIPLLGLSLFLVLAVRTFEKDKIAYIFDSSLSVSKNRAARVSSEISTVISIMQAVVLSYQADTKTLAEVGAYYFNNDKRLEGFQLFAWDPETNGSQRTVELVKDTGREIVASHEQLAKALVSQLSTQELVGVRPPGVEKKIFLAARFGAVDDPKRLVAVTLVDASDLAQVFMEAGAYRTFLARKDGKPIFISEGVLQDSWTSEDIWSELSRFKTPEGIAELKSPAQQQYLASFVDVGVADLVVISLVNKADALLAVTDLIRRSIALFAALIAFTAILAVFAARGLTGALSRLSYATRKIAGGDFGFRVEVKSGGEIGVLANSFNVMAEEVSRLMKETAEKARMESELATAKTVQETLFPDSNADLGAVQISGYYMPASECGGDWWYYCENGDKVYIWIGDATGHGAPAALLTSAARAVASVIHYGPPRPVSESLGVLNRAICETSKGKMMMTFFLACIDRRTGVMTYANASHEPPMLLHATDATPSRDDFIPLNQVNNPRLGEQIDCVFKETALQLKPGDRVVLYTDGVVDVKSPEQKTWGERRFLKALANELGQPQAVSSSLDGVIRTLHEFRSETPLDDDVTLILFDYREAV